MRLHVALGTDHGGFALKNELISHIKEDHELVDMGAHTLDPHDDYTDYSKAVARAVVSGQAQRGIVICGSGVGACVAANKVVGARACVCHDTYSAHQGVEHDDINILCLGARVIGTELAKELVTAFLNARFSTKERYRRRLEKILAIERESLQGGSKI